MNRSTPFVIARPKAAAVHLEMPTAWIAFAPLAMPNWAIATLLSLRVEWIAALRSRRRQ
ncbi:MAG: hypothetical protein WCH44_01970 [Betaproteobacteria bacterium]